MKIGRETRVVTACRGGQVRSVSARFILADKFGCRKVIACGLEKNDYETLNFLFGWAEVILVCGSVNLWNMLGDCWKDRAIHLDIGPDRWGHYGNGELVGILTPMIEGLVK